MAEKKNYKRLTVLVNPELFSDLKIVVAVRNMTMSRYVERLLMAALMTERNNILKQDTK